MLSGIEWRFRPLTGNAKLTIANRRLHKFALFRCLGTRVNECNGDLLRKWEAPSDSE